MNIPDNNFGAFAKRIKSNQILKKYDLDSIGVFGSFARGEAANDIDICVDVESCDYQKLLPLKQELEHLTHKKVDIMIKKYANPIVMHRAQKDMKYVTE
jgi:predicted nucleotidyltransferase